MGKISNLKRTAIGLAAIAATALSPVLASDEDKALRATGPLVTTGLTFQMEPMKTLYEVGEPVKLRVKGSQPFFLTVFSEDLETGQVTTLLPSRAQPGNKYPAGGFYTVPNPGVTFTADRPGRILITAVASSESLNLDVSRFKAQGDFYTAPRDEVYPQLESKGMRVRPVRRPIQPTQPAPTEPPPVVSTVASLVAQTVEISVKPRPSLAFGSLSPATAPGLAQDAVVLLSSNRTAYRIGERARLVFGADKPGTMTIYVIEPNGQYSKLLTRAVDGNTLQSVDTVVRAPSGGHTVVAVYSEAPADHAEVITQILGANAGRKGLELVGDGSTRSPTPAHAIYEFRVLD